MRSSQSPEKPVYKLESRDRFIYFNPSSEGWRIGNEENLLPGEKEGASWFQSKYHLVC